MLNPELADLQLLRQKATAGTLTLEEVKRALSLIRKSRESATHKKAGKKKPAVDTDKLLGELGGL